MKTQLEWYLMLRNYLKTEREFYKSKKDKKANKCNHYLKLLNEDITTLVVQDYEEQHAMLQEWNQKSFEDLKDIYETSK